MIVSEIIALKEFFWGDGDPLPEPEWLDDLNKTLWQEKSPTTKDDRFVKQLNSRIFQQLLSNQMFDMANQQIRIELEKLESVNEAGSARVWSRSGGKQTRKFRCLHGARKGQVRASPAACNAPINVKKSVGLKATKAKRSGQMKVKSAITRRANPASKRLTRLNKPRKSPFGRKKFK